MTAGPRPDGATGLRPGLPGLDAGGYVAAADSSGNANYASAAVYAAAVGAGSTNI